jgi:hypothetical protein
MQRRYAEYSAFVILFTSVTRDKYWRTDDLMRERSDAVVASATDSCDIVHWLRWFQPAKGKLR